MDSLMHPPHFTTLCAGAVFILQTATPEEKSSLSRKLAALWQEDQIPLGEAEPPLRPNRPDKPDLLMPKDMPKRRKAGTLANKTALLHSLAHIELNAIDLCWDIIARFPGMPKAFYDDWVKVADDEARHFMLIQNRLLELESEYGALPAHDGLWETAIDTKDNLLARLAIVPMVLEARGLDVTPGMAQTFRNVGDDKTADIIQIIHDDEIHHVKYGKAWFDYLCEKDGLEPISTWQHLVLTYFKGKLKRPFNYTSRNLANFQAAFYDPISV